MILQQRNKVDEGIIKLHKQQLNIQVLYQNEQSFLIFSIDKRKYCFHEFSADSKIQKLLGFELGSNY